MLLLVIAGVILLAVWVTTNKYNSDEYTAKVSTHVIWDTTYLTKSKRKLYTNSQFLKEV